MRVKQFLKSAAHQHKDPQVRLAHARELDPGDEEAATVLAALATDDEAVEVRVGATGRLLDLSVLRSLLDANGDDAELVREAAERRLGTLIESGEMSDVAVRALLDTHAARLAPMIASDSPVATQREHALDALDDETALVGVIQRSRLHDTRLAAASRLTRHDAMRAALTACRSRDKVVAKLLQQRLDAEAAAEAARIASRHAVTTTLEAMRNLADSVWSPQHAGRAQALRERWAGFEASDVAGESDAFSEIDARVQALLDAHPKSATEDDGRTATSESPSATADDSFTDPADGSSGAPDASAGGTAAASTSTDSAPASTAPAPEPDAGSVALAADLGDVGIEALLAAVGPDAAGADAAATDAPAAPDAGRESPLSAALRAHARAVAVLFDPPFDHRRARPAALGQRLRRVDALLDTNALLPGLDLDSHRYVRELAAHRETLAARLVQSEQESADRIKATHRQFAALGGLAGEGKWAPANSLMTRLRKKLAAMEPAERAGLEDKFARAEKQLAEMGDWQDFAARPKLEALCVEMEALPGKELAPEKLAKEVRDLQSQWKGLGPSRAANELWPRFKTAGDTAYEPCKAWFAVKGEERKEKIAARRGICEALEADVVMLGNAYVADEPEPEADADVDAGAAAPGAAAKGDGGAADGPVADPNSPAADENGVEAGGETGPDGAAVSEGASPAFVDTSEAAPATTEGPATDASADGSAGASPDGSSEGPTDGVTSDASPEPGPSTDRPAAKPAGKTSARRSRGGRAHRPLPEIPDVDPDWKAVQRRVSDAKRDWSANRVHGRKPDRSLEGRFSAALRPFERALATRYGANEAEKRALVEKAAALAGGEITQHVANQAKSLLSAWKLVGIMPRRVDQALWEEFNGHLGTIFKHQQAVQREKRRAGFEHVDRAKAISRELRALAKQDSVDEAAVQALADEFQALAEFPERDRRGLERDFRASLDATARVQETAGKRRKQAEREERQRLVELCERLEAAVEDPGAAPDNLREDVVHAWEASETRVAREMMSRLESRRDAALAHLDAGTGHDLAANEETRRDLLIRMEVAADVETPPEDKARRMKYQLENLQSGMTSAGVADRRATLAALEEEWLAAAPASRAVHDALHSRYLRAQGR